MSWRHILREGTDEDRVGNKVMRCSRLSLTANLRYVVRDQVVFFSVKDLLSTFGGDDPEEVIWERLPMELKGQVYVCMHAFSGTEEVDTFDMFTLNFSDCVKVLFCLPGDLVMQCMNVDIFLQYYVSYFHVEYKTEKNCCYDMCMFTEILSIFSFGLGLLCGCLLMRFAM